MEDLARSSKKVGFYVKLSKLASINEMSHCSLVGVDVTRHLEDKLTHTHTHSTIQNTEEHVIMLAFQSEWSAVGGPQPGDRAIHNDTKRV